MSISRAKTNGSPIPILRGILPIAGAQVPAEIIAGVTLAALAIPEVMGYTNLIGKDFIFETIADVEAAYRQKWLWQKS